MKNYTYFVSGANRGIGLEFVKQLINRGERVIASTRNIDNANSLVQLSKTSNNLNIVELDISEGQSIQNLSNSIKEPIDVLINNAGRYSQSGSFPDLNFKALEDDFVVNTVGTLKLCGALLSQIKQGKGKIIANITSKMGSISDNSSGGSYSYRISKTALNMGIRCLSHDLRDDEISAFVLHPGWVQTDMGGSNALINTHTSVSGMLETIDQGGLELSGKFWEWNGNEIAW